MRSFPIVVSKGFLQEYQIQNQVTILHDHVSYPLKEHTLKSTFQVSKIACYECLKNIEIRSELRNEVGMYCQTQNKKHLDTKSRTWLVLLGDTTISIISNNTILDTKYTENNNIPIAERETVKRKLFF